MAKRYILLELDDGGGGGGGDGDWGEVIVFVIVCAVLIVIYMKLFGAYNDSDFSEAKYINRAREGAEHLVWEWQGRNWRPRGFTDEIQILSNEPAFAVRVVRGKTPHKVTYLGHGKFETAVDTVTVLKSKNKQTVEVRESFFVQFQTDMNHGWLYRVFRGDQWQLTFGEQYYMSPTLPEINALIQRWSTTKQP